MDAEISRLTHDKIAVGKSGLLLIADNYDAFDVRLLATRNATSSLDLMYYLWHDDQTGRALMQEVVRAAERGVRVRMLLDDLNPRSSDVAYLALDGHPSIEVKLFNPSGMRNGSVFRLLELVSRAFAMTRRMHNKAWIADDSVAIVGGRNIGNAYFDAAETNFRDLDLLLLGPAVQQTRRIFSAFWNCDAATPIQLLNASEQGERTGYLDRLAGKLEPSPSGSFGSWRSMAEFVAASNGICWTNSVRVISDPPEKVCGERRGNWLTEELLPIMRSTSESLEIVSPYFIPGRNGFEILTGLAKRGAQVAVVTNSLAATDVAAVHGAYSKYRWKLIQNGIQLFELQPCDRQPSISVFGSKGASLHTKAFPVEPLGAARTDALRTSEIQELVGQALHAIRRQAQRGRRFENCIGKG